MSLEKAPQYRLAQQALIYFLLEILPNFIECNVHT